MHGTKFAPDCKSFFRCDYRRATPAALSIPALKGEAFRGYTVKGLVAGVLNTAIALSQGQTIPPITVLLVAATVGFVGYGVSLVLFIKSLRVLGTARTGAYFSTAPFSGAVLSIFLLHEPLTGNLLVAAILMAVGVILHVTELHDHEHTHEVLEHEHMHEHDEHHQHEHAELVVGAHSHWHRHEALTHSHPHYPDTHHRHEH